MQVCRVHKTTCLGFDRNNTNRCISIENCQHKSTKGDFEAELRKKTEELNIKELLEREGCSGVITFEDPSYEPALIGVSMDNQAIYDWQKMVDYLVENYNYTKQEAEDYIGYNVVKSFPHMGDRHPIIVNVFNRR